MASMKRTTNRRRAMAKMSTRRSVSGRPARRASARKATRRKKPAQIERAPLTGGMSVREAGRKGGLIGGRKGGLTVKRERGVEFYQEIGKKGGQRVRDLIAAGKRATERGNARRRHT